MILSNGVSGLAGREALATVALKFSRRAEPMVIVKRENSTEEAWSREEEILKPGWPLSSPA